jgi:hypothetical protein
MKKNVPSKRERMKKGIYLLPNLFSAHSDSLCAGRSGWENRKDDEYDQQVRFRVRFPV